MKLEDEIDQAKFPDEYVKGHINLIYTSGWAQLRVATALKPCKISVQQFNILRILRGRAPRPASIRELTDRMLDKSSNASRLVDKLFAKKLVEKQPSEKDSRKVEVLITEKGLALLAKASEKVDEVIYSTFDTLSENDARQLNLILDKLRD